MGAGKKRGESESEKEKKERLDKALDEGLEGDLSRVRPGQCGAASAQPEGQGRNLKIQRSCKPLTLMRCMERLQPLLTAFEVSLRVG